jgi:histidinol phosphatase-like PHP family hydrolase
MELSEYWPIRVISGCEITHAPIEQFPDLVVRARERGVQLVVAHGETTTEPVLEGTNAAAIKAGVDILAHPGLISDEDLKLAVKNQVALELSLREKQFDGNVHLLNRIREHKLTESALILLNADSHTGEQIKSDSVVDFFINNCLGEYSEVERNVLMSRISASIQIVVSRCQGIV